MLDHQPFTVKVAGSPGSLDTTFGTSGRVVFPLPDPAIAATTGNGYSRGLVIYPPSAGADADKILIAAEIETTGAASTSRKLAVVRLNPDGTLDTSFGGGAPYALIDGSPATPSIRPESPSTRSSASSCWRNFRAPRTCAPSSSHG